mgnify:CR=1 FL=1
MEFKKSGPLKGEITVPGDKSISHRAVMFGSLAKGTTEITGFLQGADCLSTISCFERMALPLKIKGISSWYMEMAFTVLKSRRPYWTAETAALLPA